MGIDAGFSVGGDAREDSGGLIAGSSEVRQGDDEVVDANVEKDSCCEGITGSVETDGSDVVAEVLIGLEN